MGACDISMTLPGHFTREQVMQAFRDKQEEDRDYNGHQEGYSGDFQTVHGVKFHDSEPFTDENIAYEYCLDHAEKRQDLIAVKHKVGDIEYWLVAGWGAC